LPETLQSALAQTYSRTEIIVVDDGSTDSSGTIAQSYSSARLRVLAQENAGQSAAFNRALREAQGDYFEYLDADDLLHPEKIARQIAALKACDSARVASGAWARFTSDPASARFEQEAIWSDLAAVDWLVSSWSGGGMMHGAAWLVPRAVAERAGSWGEDLSLVNDFDYFARVLLQSSGVKFCSEARTYYRSGLSGSLSDQKSPRAWRSAFDSFTRGTSALLAREDSPRTRRAAAITFQSFAFGAYPAEPALVLQAERRVRELGGCDLRLRCGLFFNMLARSLGWKTARRIQHFYHRQIRAGTS
jgi:glycosyltransferase involved in cell wall biosynthesis